MWSLMISKIENPTIRLFILLRVSAIFLPLGLLVCCLNQRKDTLTRRANSSFSRMMVCVTFVMTTWKIMMLHWHNQGFSWQFSISFKLLGSVLCGGLLSSNVSDCSLLGYRQSYREDCELRLEWQHRILISILFTTQYTTKLITINWTKNMSRNLNFN